MADGMTPEARARLRIGKQFEQAGWVVQDRLHIDLNLAVGLLPIKLVFAHDRL